MRKSNSSWDFAKITICLGVLCITGAITSNVAGVVYAQCANMTVRANSPCKTVVAVCGSPVWVPTQGSNQGYYTCSGYTETPGKGNFQCDSPKSGTTCTGSGFMAFCYAQSSCIYYPNQNPSRVGRCDARANGSQSFNAETKKEVPCAG